MVFRIFVERKQSHAHEAEALFSELKDTLGIDTLTGVRLLNRYDTENIDKEVFDRCIDTVFAQPQTDRVCVQPDYEGSCAHFCVEFLPGQFDQRASSAEQCIQIICKTRPTVKTAKEYIFYGSLTQLQIEKIKSFLINPVECRLAETKLPKTLQTTYDKPQEVPIIDGFTQMDDGQLEMLQKEYGLAMDIDDLNVCKQYFSSVSRQPTLTELKVVDTYWSDHCRHTTFLTQIDSAEFFDPVIEKSWVDYLDTRKALGIKKKICLMDLATVAAKKLRAEGNLENLDQSDEINACTVKIKVETQDGEQDFLLLFKNETHNHPTEIEPFGGAATCIGGAIRDPLSGRAYVYSAMRITGAGNPLTPYNQTLSGRLPQKKIVTSAAAGYSSYGNQIGLATNLVDELYHQGYRAKRMEIGAVLGAVQAKNVVRLVPQKDDVIILLGGATGRDGCGGATGSSKSHTSQSLEVCGSEVQKGNAPEERKLQRLFANPEASLLIKRCNDFGAGGVSVAIGELAEGVDINLDLVPKKYEGLSGTELAISESQERMAVVVDIKDAQKFISLAQTENLTATAVATVTDDKKMTMRFCGKVIACLDRHFLDSNGAVKHARATVEAPQNYLLTKNIPNDFEKGFKDLVCDLNICDKRGLGERFDSTIGTLTVLMPFGGKTQRSPIQSMVSLIPAKRNTTTCSVMSWGYNPFISQVDPYRSAYLAVVESISKLVAQGANRQEVYLTFQEYFEKLRNESARWGKPLAALLGAFRAQCELSSAAIGGKDSMSGSFEQLDVPPTLVSFAVTTARQEDITVSHFTKADSFVYLLSPKFNDDLLPEKDSLLALFDFISSQKGKKLINSARTCTYGGVAEAIFKMCLGDNIGFAFEDKITLSHMFGYCYGSFVVESDEKIDLSLLGEINFDCIALGKTCLKGEISQKNTKLSLDELYTYYRQTLQPVYPTSCQNNADKNCQKGIADSQKGDNDTQNASLSQEGIKKNLPKTMTVSFDKKTEIGAQVRAVANRAASIRRNKAIKVLIPVFAGTNCENDTSLAFERAGAHCQIFIVRNRNRLDIEQSIEQFEKLLGQCNILFIPGGFSGGDEPDGSGKFITSFLRNEKIAQTLQRHIQVKKNLVGGICNGFQALVKLGLLPYGKILEPSPNYPTLTFNDICRHQSRIVSTRVSSTMSPWFSKCSVGQIYTVPISHGEGKFIASSQTFADLIGRGQIATQYVDEEGRATMDINFNPSGSLLSVECITSQDGLIMGKMGHTERYQEGLYKNVEGNYAMPLFESAVEYFK